MNQHIASTLGCIGSVAGGRSWPQLMSGNALAEGPIEVLAAIRRHLEPRRGALPGDAGPRPRHQLCQRVEPAAGSVAGPHERLGTRAQARADFIAARDQVHAMTAEDSGSSYVAQGPVHTPATTVAGGSQLNSTAGARLPLFCNRDVSALYPHGN